MKEGEGFRIFIQYPEIFSSHTQGIWCSPRKSENNLKTDADMHAYGEGKTNTFFIIDEAPDWYWTQRAVLQLKGATYLSHWTLYEGPPHPYFK